LKSKKEADFLKIARQNIAKWPKKWNKTQLRYIKNKKKDLPFIGFSPPKDLKGVFKKGCICKVLLPHLRISPHTSHTQKKLLPTTKHLLR
jgi:hypothetical protein